MKTKYLIIAAFASVLASCSNETGMEESTVTPVSGEKTEVVTTKQPVQFGAYVNRATTRAGDAGVLVTSGSTAGQVSLQEKGFGVMAYYTDDDLYSPIYVPNFMYNTQVSYNTTANAWTYEPVQYWPNETGANAVSEDVDRLSFFAYAPYVDVTNNTGIVTGDATTGIVGLSRNGATGDPLVKYYVDLDPAKQVDFCWGTPQIDLTKQAVDDKVSFVFNHALAALNVQIDAMVDELAPGSKTLGDETRIFVRSVSFEGFVTKGAFNLNTTKATWYDLAGQNYIDGGSVTIYDGRTNGREGQSESVNEAPQGLNPVIVQDVPYSDDALQAGVTNSAVNLFSGATAAPVFVIPSGQPLRVTIVYDVETATDELPGYLSDGVTHGTSVENKITKTITLADGSAMKLEAGKTHTINLHLGMTSVKFDATVSDWVDGAAGSSTSEVGLPDNTIGIGSVDLTLDSNPLTIITRWIGDTSAIPTPLVTVKDANGDTMTKGITCTWSSSDDAVATVDPVTGEISVQGPGSATITVTATDSSSSKTASFTFNVNAVTGIVCTPAVINMTLSSVYPSPLTVTLTHTNYGTISLPDELINEMTQDGVVTLSTPTKVTTGNTTTYQYTVTSSDQVNSTTATFTPGSTYTSLGAGTVNINVLTIPTVTGNATGQGFTWDN